MELRTQSFVIQYLVHFFGLGLIGRHVVAFDIFLRLWGLEFINGDVVCLLVVSLDKKIMPVELLMGFREEVEVMVLQKLVT